MRMIHAAALVVTGFCLTACSPAVSSSNADNAASSNEKPPQDFDPTNGTTPSERELERQGKERRDSTPGA